MLWFKAFHIVFVVTWFAGLFYLPRLFVYHADTAEPATVATFKVMERRLLTMMHIGGVLALIFGIALIVQRPGLLTLPWMHAKLTLVAALWGYHFWCVGLVRAFAADRNRHSQRWYRWFNEVPSLVLVAVVLLAVIKPG